MSIKSKAVTVITILSLTAVLSAGSVLMNANPAASAASSSVLRQNSGPIQVTLNGGSYIFENAPLMDKGTVYVPLRDLGEMLGIQVFWDITTKDISITYPGTLIHMPFGGKEAIINGKKVTLGTPARIIDGRAYLPLRFVSESLGINVQWNAAKRTVAVTHSSAYTKGLGVNTALWLNRKTGEVLVAHPFNTKPVSIGKLDLDLKEHVTIDAQLLTGGGMMLTVIDNYGEPHIHNDVYTAYVKNNKIVKQAKAYYFKRFERSIVSYDNHPLLLDGKTLTVLDNEGTVVKTYDLPALGGKDEEYSVAAASERFLIIRPNDTGLLTLINLKDNSRTLLYKELLTPEEQEYSEKNDIPYYGDELRFYEASENGILTFSYDSPFTGKNRILHYTMKP